MSGGRYGIHYCIKSYAAIIANDTNRLKWCKKRVLIKLNAILCTLCIYMHTEPKNPYLSSIDLYTQCIIYCRVEMHFNIFDSRSYTVQLIITNFVIEMAQIVGDEEI